jgi:hypothetical protein
VPTDRLLWASLLYLALPYVLFALGWLRPEMAVTGLLALGVMLWFVARQEADSVAFPPISGATWLALATLAALLTLMAGVGGVFPQKADYDKHNLLFHDLLTLNSPVRYQHPTYSTVFLCYYVAYYLPAAYAAKALGLASIEALSFAWAGLGLSLSQGWVYRWAGWRGIGYFWLFSGLAVIAAPHNTAQEIAHLFGFDFVKNEDFFIWCFSGKNYEFKLEFPAFYSQLQWAPQHAIVAWIATPMMLWAYRKNKNYWSVIQTLTLLWSPFVTLGLLPLSWLCWRRQGLPSLASVGYWFGGIFWGGSMLLYYQSHWPLSYRGFIWEGWASLGDMLLFFFYLFCQIGLLLLVFWLHRSTLKDRIFWQKISTTAAVFIGLLSIFYVGKFNDLFMRGILPSATLLILSMAQINVSFLKNNNKKLASLLFLIWLTLSAYEPLRNMAKSGWSLYKKDQQPVQRSVARAQINWGERDLAHMSRDRRFPEVDFAIQYLGRSDSFFGKYLLKKPKKPPQ